MGDKALSWTEVYYSVLNNCDLIKMTRDDHEEDNGEIIGEDTELLPTASLEGLDFDRLLVEKIGEFGPYQKRLYLLVCLPAALTAAITMARSCLVDCLDDG